jgi:hypothetical protein
MSTFINFLYHEVFCYAFSPGFKSLHVLVKCNASFGGSDLLLMKKLPAFFRIWFVTFQGKKWLEELL